MLLDKLSAKKRPLKLLTLGGMNGIINAGRISRTWVSDPKYGIPFLSSTDVLQADLNNVSFIARKAVDLNPQLTIHEGWTLITRSGSIGKMAYCRADMNGMACTEDVLRVVPDPNEILPGYLYAYLSSKFGRPLVKEGTYGQIVQHIEPQHIADLPVPRLEEDVEETAHHKITRAATLRSEYQAQVKEATDLLFRAVGLEDFTAIGWHKMGPDTGFSHTLKSSESLRALNFNPRLHRCLSQLSHTNHMLLGDICDGGKLRRGLRFKRVDCDPDFGIRFIGQRELFYMEPEGRWIAARYAPNDIFVNDETVLIAAQGTLGEHEVFCRAELITGPWVQYGYTEHLLRVQLGNSSISGAFLFAFLRSEMVFRCLRSISIGGKQQDLHHSLLSQLPVPLPSEATRSKIERLVRNAFAKRHEASRIEQEAVETVEKAIEEGARWQKSSQ
jgi:hypothetical protein